MYHIDRESLRDFVAHAFSVLKREIMVMEEWVKMHYEIITAILFLVDIAVKLLR